MFKCFCCGQQYNEQQPPKFCRDCGASTQEGQNQIDSVSAVESYRSLLEAHYFESHTELDIKYRVKLKISFETHESLLNHFKAQKKALDSLGKFTVEFDENVIEAYAGNDTHLKFKFTNLSEEMLRVRFFWDDPETDDDFDLKIESKSFVKPGSSVIIGGSHVFSRIGIKEISDLYVTVIDPFQQVKFRSSPIVFKVGNSDQKITQHFTTNNQISIEGRGVVDASGMGKDSNGPMLQTSVDAKWTPLNLIFIPKELPSIAPTTSAPKQSQVISNNVKNSGLTDPNDSSAFDEADLKSIESAANANNLAAINALGCKYYMGVDVEENLAQAFEYFMRAAAQGYAASQSNLGQSYEYGYGVSVNPQKAVEWYLKSAEQKHKVGLFNAGRCFLNGFGVQQDEAKARELLEAAVSAGHLAANALLGDLYAHGLAVIKDPRLAAEFYLKAALAGDDYGQLRLANLYEKGDGVPLDTNLAIKWYTESANKDNALAQYNLALMYWGTEPHIDVNLCAKFLTDSANNDHAPAQTFLSRLYVLGQGVEQDLDLARSWLEKAVANGDQQAVSLLKDFDEQSFSDSHIDCDCPAMDESLEKLDIFLNSFDAHAYGEDEIEEKNYFSDSEVSVELETVICDVIAQNTGWPMDQFHGILIENIHSIATSSDDLMLTFDGHANAIFKSGVATICIKDNSLEFDESFEWHEKTPDEFSFWISGGKVFLGNVGQNFFRWGGSWFVGETVAPTLQESVNSANSWISRIFSIAKGEVDSQQVLYPDDTPFARLSAAARGEDDSLRFLYSAEEKSVSDDEEDEEGGPQQLADGSVWYGELDSEGMLTGFGTWIWPNGDRYDGYCANGFLNGEGTLVWETGERYEGTWLNGNRHGQGVNVKVDGSRQEGNWDQGSFVDVKKKEGFFSSFTKGFKEGLK